jgi:translation initiation factor RLI1
MEKKTYNGWTNYATWRVNLELLDGYETSIESNLEEYLDIVEDGTISDEDKIDLVHDLSRELKSVVEEIMDSYDTDSIVRSYADAFLSDVDYYDIAENKFLSISSKLIELAQEQTN